jgi:hypothetical protein
MTQVQQTKCKTRWKENKNERMKDLRKLFGAYQDGCEEKYAEQLGVFSEYGLAFDYVLRIHLFSPVVKGSIEVTLIRWVFAS